MDSNAMRKLADTLNEAADAIACRDMAEAEKEPRGDCMGHGPASFLDAERRRVAEEAAAVVPKVHIGTGSDDAWLYIRSEPQCRWVLFAKMRIAEVGSLKRLQAVTTCVEECLANPESKGRARILELLK